MSCNVKRCLHSAHQSKIDPLTVKGIRAKTSSAISVVERGRLQPNTHAFAQSPCMAVSTSIEPRLHQGAYVSSATTRLGRGAGANRAKGGSPGCRNNSRFEGKSKPAVISPCRWISAAGSTICTSCRKLINQDEVCSRKKGPFPRGLVRGPFFSQKRKIVFVLQMRAELVRLRTLTLAAKYSGHRKEAERDEVFHRILRMAELLRKMREIAKRN
jgi:hypothetical protein